MYKTVIINKQFHYFRMDKIIGDHQCGVLYVIDQLPDQIFCIHQILEKKNWSTVRQYISYLQTSKRL
jgi:hypothetical protein